MRFLSVVRDRNKSAIVQPVQKGFSAQQWDAAYAENTDRSPEDQSTFEFGKFLDGHLQGLRNELGDIEKKTLSTPWHQVVMALCERMNKEHVHIVAKGTAFLKERTSVSIEEMLTHRGLEGTFGGHYTVHEVLDGWIDAARLPLREAIRRGSYGTAGSESASMSLDESLTRAFDIAQLYNSSEALWQGQLWFESRFDGRRLPSHRYFTCPSRDLI